MEPFQYQAAALAEIVARARAFYDGYWRELPIKPRFNTVVVAPTGVGKTALASMAAEAIGGGATLLRLSVPGWIPGGSTGRTVAETIGTIAQAVALNQRTLLVLDELDKATPPTSLTTSTSAWQQHCLLEIYDLLDGRWPAGLKLPDDAEDNEISRADLTKKLQTSVYILGVGTFQDFFDGNGNRRTIGFGAESDTETDEISSDDLLEKLPRELVNRFSGLIRLPELQAEHYHHIAKQACDSLPERMRHAFSEAVAARIGAAITAKKGVRFLEECVMEVLKSLPPEPRYEIILAAKTETIDPFDQICTL